MKELLNLDLLQRRTLRALMIQNVADAEILCREGDVPSSKIYLALEKLAKLGLVDVQPTRPKLFCARPAEEIFAHLVEMAQERADKFGREVLQIKERFSKLPAPESAGRTAFVDLALGREGQLRRHLVHLSAAHHRVLSYMEQIDIDAFGAADSLGIPLLRRIARNNAAHQIDYRVVFGFGYRAAPKLVSFLRKQRSHLVHVTGVRYSAELGHPFHVIDDAIVILGVDHPFVSQGRVASLLIRDPALARRLAGGFETLWTKAMKNLQEISFQPSS